jgi:hypothetical protein
VTADVQLYSAHTITAGAGWVGSFTTSNGGFEYPTAAIVIGP